MSGGAGWFEVAVCWCLCGENDLDKLVKIGVNKSCLGIDIGEVLKNLSTICTIRNIGV